MITVILTDAAGTPTGERPLSGTFKSGERFRLRLTPTFSGLLELEHLGPDGTRTQLFPKPGIEGFIVNAGSALTLPLGNAVYEFDAEKGDEHFVFRLRDPRLTTVDQSSGGLLSEDVGSITALGQHITAGHLPFIAQSVVIQHH